MLDVVAAVIVSRVPIRPAAPTVTSAFSGDIGAAHPVRMMAALRPAATVDS